MRMMNQEKRKTYKKNVEYFSGFTRLHFDRLQWIFSKFHDPTLLTHLTILRKLNLNFRFELLWTHEIHLQKFRFSWLIPYHFRFFSSLLCGRFFATHDVCCWFEIRLFHYIFFCTHGISFCCCAKCGYGK